MRNKKAEQSLGIIDMMHYLPRIMIIVVLIFFTVTVVNSSINNEVNVFGAEADMMMYRVLYSRVGVSYFDSDLGRLYPGVIDMKKFNKEHIEKKTFAISDDERHITMKLELTVNGAEKVVYVNEKWYSRWAMFIDFDKDTGEFLTITGKGGKDAKVEKYIVKVIEEDGTITSGTLVMKVVMSRV